VGLGQGTGSASGVGAEVEAETPPITQFSYVLASGVVLEFFRASPSTGGEEILDSDTIFRNVFDAMKPAVSGHLKVIHLRTLESDSLGGLL
jgi:hypothetical protein